MESFCTDFNGLTRWIPSGSVSPVTRPNSVNTPTFPVGIDVVLAISRMITSTRMASCNILFPDPLKLILGNPSPPRSNLVVVGISPSVLQLIRANFGPHHPQILNTQPVSSRFPCRSAPGGCFDWAYLPQVSRHDSPVCPACPDLVGDLIGVTTAP